MSMKERLRKLERDALPAAPLRVVYVEDGADKSTEYDRQRQQGYRGPLAVLDETDGNL